MSRMQSVMNILLGWFDNDDDEDDGDDIFMVALSSNRDVYLKYEVSMLLKYLMIKV